MKKKKVSEKENEWKGVLVDDNQGVKMYEYNKDGTKGYFYQVGESNVTPDSFTVTSTNVNGEVVGEVNVNKSYGMKMESNSRSGYNEEDIKRIKILEWDESFLKHKNPDKKVLLEFENPNKGSDYDIDKEHCNVGVNKDWENSEFSKNIKKVYEFTENDFENWDKQLKQKDKRIDFEFTPKTFWQLLPSIALNLHCKEIELTWLCFGCYINLKKWMK
jgi:hypothetical protein